MQVVISNVRLYRRSESGMLRVVEVGAKRPKFPVVEPNKLRQLVDEYKATTKGKQLIRESGKVGNCMMVSEDLEQWLLKRGVNAENYQCAFHFDHDSDHISPPTADDYKWMEKEGVDVRDKQAVKQFMHYQYDMSNITHWIVVVDGRYIVDLSGGAQFVKTGVADNLDKRHYKFDSFTSFHIRQVFH